MFDLSRELPLRDFCWMLNGEAAEPRFDEAFVAAISLADTLRRRLMEQAL